MCTRLRGNRFAMLDPQTLAFHDDLGLDELEGVILNHGTPKSLSTLADTIDSPSSVRSSGPSKMQYTILSDHCSRETLLPSPFRDNLVQLYFHHVHPLCPVVDQHHFDQLYRSTKISAFLQQFSTALYQAMMFAAIQVGVPFKLK